MILAGTASIPIIVVAEDDDGGNAVTPVLERDLCNRNKSQIIYVLIDHKVKSRVVGIVEDFDAGSAREANGRDSVVESRGNKGRTLTLFHTEEVSSIVRFQIKACLRSLGTLTWPMSLERRLALIGGLTLIGSLALIGRLPSIVIVSLPLVAFAEDGDRRDAVVPALFRIFGKPENAQVWNVVIDHPADAAEVGVIEEA